MRGLRGTVGCLAVVVALTSSQPSQAEPPGGGPFGLGVIVGDPTGLTGKYWFTEQHTLDFHLGWDFTHDSFGIYADYLFHFLYINQSRPRVAGMPLYVGGGLVLGFDDDGHHHHHHNGHDHDHDSEVFLGLRVPFGIAFLFNRVPFEVFIELAPSVHLSDDAHFDLDGGGGFRYYF